MEKLLLHRSSSVFYKVEDPKARQPSAPPGPTILLVHGFAEDSRVWDPLVRAWDHPGRLIIPDLPGSGRSEFPIRQRLPPKEHPAANTPSGNIPSGNTPSGNNSSPDLLSKPSPSEPAAHPAAPAPTPVSASAPSPAPATSPALSLEELAETLISILDKEGIEQCILIGHSMGGYIGLALAEKYPERLLALGLFHSTAYPDSEEKKLTRQKNIGFIQRNGADDFVKQATPNLFSEAFKKEQPDMVSSFTSQYSHFDPQALIAYTEAMMNRPDRTHLLSAFHGPVLFVSGELDSVIPLTQTLRESHLPVISHIHILEHSAHMGMLEETQASRNILQAFAEYLSGFPA